jgi:NAD(P)-dependent dehydrogenase (short-subunit alcohol dehydrogenase family)
VQGAKALAGQFVDVACDVTDEASLKAAFATVVEQAGALDGLVNNAGIISTARATSSRPRRTRK